MKLISILFLFSNLAFAETYPEHWWQEYSRESAPNWEVLPQDAAYKREVVLSKRNELGQFSNFAQAPFELDGIHFESVEGLWQSLKFPENKNDPRALYYQTPWKFSREQVRNMAGFTAKKAGNYANQKMEEMDISWVSHKGDTMVLKTPFKGEHYQLIYRAIRQKLISHPQLQKLLLQTQGLELIPDHKMDWYLPPAWKYHKILMELRDEIQTKGILK